MLFTKKHNLVIPHTGVGWFTGLCYSTYEFFQGTYREPVVRSDKVYYEELEGGEVYKAMLFFGVTAGPRSKRAKPTSFFASVTPMRSSLGLSSASRSRRKAHPRAKG
jgi:hypothetical protein